MTMLRGRCSSFGGPSDEGVLPSEGLAFIYEYDRAPWLFLDKQPPGTTGLARRLDAENVHYIATRWDYELTPKESLPELLVTVYSPSTGRSFKAYPADWGPHQDTGRVADLSPALMRDLDIETDDIVEVYYEAEEIPMALGSIVISSGHGDLVRGASGYLDERDEAVRMVDHMADLLVEAGFDVNVFHDRKSTTQSQNLDAIVDYHNAAGPHDLDISVHMNASESHEGHGTEVLYVTQEALARKLSAAIAQAGQFTDRGPKHRTDLAFLNGTREPAVLLEVAFCDHAGDAELYERHFDAICRAVVTALGGVVDEGEPIEPPPAEVEQTVTITINAPPGVRVVVIEESAGAAEVSPNLKGKGKRRPPPSVRPRGR